MTLGRQTRELFNLMAELVELGNFWGEAYQCTGDMLKR